MKTAVELVGIDYDVVSEVVSSCGPPMGRPIGQVAYQLTVAQLELVAKRAREEMRTAACQAAADAAVDGFYDQSAASASFRIVAAINALPVE